MSEQRRERRKLYRDFIKKQANAYYNYRKANPSRVPSDPIAGPVETPADHVATRESVPVDTAAQDESPIEPLGLQGETPAAGDNACDPCDDYDPACTPATQIEDDYNTYGQ